MQSATLPVGMLAHSNGVAGLVGSPHVAGAAAAAVAPALDASVAAASGSGSVGAGTAADWAARYALDRSKWEAERTRLLTAVDEHHARATASEHERAKLAHELHTWQSTHARLHASHTDAGAHIAHLEATVAHRAAEVGSLTRNLKAQADAIEQLMFTRTHLKARLTDFEQQLSATGPGDVDRDGKSVSLGWVLRKLCSVSAFVDDQKRAVGALLDGQSRTLHALQHHSSPGVAGSALLGSPLRANGASLPLSPGAPGNDAGGAAAGAAGVLLSVDSLRAQSERHVRDLSALLAQLTAQVTSLADDRQRVTETAADRVHAWRAARAVRVAFRAWRTRTQQVRRRTALLHKHMERVRRQCVQRVLQQLEARDAQRRDAARARHQHALYKQQLKVFKLQLFDVQANGLARKYFVAWQLFVSGRKRAHHILARVVSRTRTAALRQAWTQWAVRYVADVRRQATAQNWQLRLRGVFGRHFASSQRQQLIDAFRRWTLYVTQRRNYRRTVLRKLIEQRVGGVGRAFARWRGFVTHGVHAVQLAAVQHAAAAERERAEHELAQTLETAAATYAAQRNRLKRARLYHGWRLAVVVKEFKFQTLNQAYSVSVRNHALRYLQTAFQHWHWLVAERQRRRDMLTRLGRELLKRSRHGRTAHAWSTWRRFVDADRAAVTLHTQLSHVTGLLNAQKQRSAKAIIQRWRQGSLVPAFTHWRTVVASTRARKRTLMAHALLRWAQASSWRAWRTWRSFVEHGRVCDLQERMNDEKHKRAAEMIRRWRLQSLVPAFERWKEWARESRTHKRDTLRRTLARMLNSQLWNGWRQWRRHVEQQRIGEYKARVLQSQTKRRADLIKRWRHASLYPAFERWKEYLAERRVHKRELLKRMLNRWQRTELWRGWRHWRDYVEHHKIGELQQRMTLEKHKRGAEIIRRWRLQSLIPAFEKWREHVHERKTRKAQIMRSAVVRWQRAELWRGWRHWRGYVEAAQVADLKKTLSDAKHAHTGALIHKWRLASLLPAFNTWKEYVAQRKLHKRDLLRRMLLRWQRAELWRGWRHWTQYTDACRVHGLQTRMAEHKEKRKTELIRRWRLQSLLPTFERWKEFVAERRRHKRDLLKRMLMRWQSGELWRAWRLWVSWRDHGRVADMRSQLEGNTRVQKEKRIAQLIKHQHAKALVPVFGAWRRHTLDRKAGRRTTATRMLKRMLHATLYRGWRTWRVDFVNAARVDALQQAFEADAEADADESRRSGGGRAATPALPGAAASAGRVLRRVFHDAPDSLRRIVSKRRERALTHLIKRVSGAVLGPAFRAWTLHVRDVRRSRRQVMTRTLVRMQHSALWRGWRTWRAFVDRQARVALQERWDALNKRSAATARAAIQRMLTRQNQVTVSSVFLSWRHVARAGAARRRALLTTTLKRWLHAELWRAWRTWTRWVYGADRAQRDAQAQSQADQLALVTARGAEREAAAAEQARAQLRTAQRAALGRALLSRARRERTQQHFRSLQVFHGWRAHTMRGALADAQEEVAERQRDAVKSFYHWRLQLMTTRLQRSLSAMERDSSEARKHEYRLKRDTLLLLHNNGFVGGGTGGAGGAPGADPARVLAYSPELQELAKRLSADHVRIHELRAQTKDLQQQLGAAHRRVHTQHRFLTEKTTSRAAFFRSNQLLCRVFASWYEHTQRVKRRAHALGRCMALVRTVATARAWGAWRTHTVRTARDALERALLSSRAQCDALARKVAALEYRVVSHQQVAEQQRRARVAAAGAAMSPGPLLLPGGGSGGGGPGAGAAVDVSYGTPSRPVTAASSSASGPASATLEGEVERRGRAIQFLAEENAKLSALHERHLSQLSDEQQVLGAAVVAVSGLTSQLSGSGGGSASASGSAPAVSVASAPMPVSGLLSPTSATANAAAAAAPTISSSVARFLLPGPAPQHHQHHQHRQQYVAPPVTPSPYASGLYQPPRPLVAPATAPPVAGPAGFFTPGPSVARVGPFSSAAPAAPPAYPPAGRTPAAALSYGARTPASAAAPFTPAPASASALALANGVAASRPSPDRDHWPTVADFFGSTTAAAAAPSPIARR